MDSRPSQDVPESDETRERLLLAAEQVFADKGFEGASVREILERAGVKNTSAINYYFRSKDQFYVETVKNAHLSCNCGLPYPEWPQGADPEQKLRDFVRTMVLRMMKPPRTSAVQLMMREMANPTKACAEVVREYIQPMAQMLEGILSEMLPDIPSNCRFMIGVSIVGQYLIYRTNRPILALLMGEQNFQQIDPERLAEHIAEFTLSAIRGLKQTEEAREKMGTGSGQTS
jgi:TetR/AcrR family transcriptional regulator, regulator of cefoperazone and chloramphenicol sensitivity